MSYTGSAGNFRNTGQHDNRFRCGNPAWNDRDERRRHGQMERSSYRVKQRQHRAEDRLQIH
ncbi:hypothetical protein LH128_20013 [Sphingomonas sp. LH128]|nr:hypothetical protein LH128_20013 [Sphingomonas sp. LH128]